MGDIFQRFTYGRLKFQIVAKAIGGTCQVVWECKSCGKGATLNATFADLEVAIERAKGAAKIHALVHRRQR